MFADPQAAGGYFQGVCIYNPGAALGKLPFAPFRKICQQVFAGEQFQYGVSQKLEPLIVLDHRRGESYFLSTRRAQLRHRRTVRQSAFQQARISELVAEPPHQLFIANAGHVSTSAFRRHARIYFGTLSCVVLSFFASSIPCLQVACNPLWMAAHLVNAVTASSKCEAFSLDN